MFLIVVCLICFVNYGSITYVDHHRLVKHGRYICREIQVLELLPNGNLAPVDVCECTRVIVSARL
jgi:hypothetical protein